ncbi:ABC transporter permease DevC [Aphanothece sacrum]|uniref:ABC-transporter DevC-like protein n=1 Tax=Aphanothece sacrum FPU1 TaxID=1920663 RepID=A0A401IMN5_APHSA|nr:ABC transporter permease DevC [Aphanothece sacrum]GBF82503.1 ABC-transporter DevC-like protein [Aphanothece sacrum FPU1]GBF85763.1 ABC transporter family protein [Aphanothece sacrum FPU3]
MKIPLAFLQLTHEKIRLIIALAGITFADVLMFMQLGFRDALFDSAVRLHKSLEGDVFVLNSKSDSFTALRSFSQRRLYDILGVNNVESVIPMYVGLSNWKNPVERQTRSVFVIGLNPSINTINLPGIAENISVIKQQDTVLFDRSSRKEFGPIAEFFDQGKTVTTEIGNRQIKVGGLFSLGTSFGADGTIITSDVNFLRLFSARQQGLIDLGVIQLKPNTNVEATLKFLRDNFSHDDIQFFSKEELIAHEKSFWQNRTSIGFIFTLGTIMGFVVGTVIVYQILYTDVADHLPEYATLKAMGYTDFYLLTLVFQEAIILGIIGFLPGFGFAMFMYINAAKATGLPIMMTLARAMTVLILTVIMCCLSGGVAVGKLRAADPADIF